MYGLVWCCTVWYDIVWYGMVLYMVWYGMVWYLRVRDCCEYFVYKYTHELNVQ